MDYTSELAVIKAGSSKIKNQFLSSVYEGFKAVIKDNIRSLRFWLPFFTFVFISVLFSLLYFWFMPFATNDLNLSILSNAFLVIVFLLFSLLVILSILIIPFIFKKTRDFDKIIIDEIGASSYWGLIIGKYLAVIILFTIFTSLTSSITFITYISLSGGNNLLYIFGKSLQQFVFGILFALIWATVFLSICVFFNYDWQGSATIIGISLIITLFIPIQALAINQKSTTKNVVLDLSGTVIDKNKELTTFSNLENKDSFYSWLAPIDPLALTSTMFNVFDGNLSNEYYEISSLEEMFHVPRKKITKEVYYNPVDYNALYTSVNPNVNQTWNSLNNSENFGEYSNLVNQGIKIINQQTYYLGEEIISTYQRINQNSELSKSIKALGLITESQAESDTGISNLTMIEAYNAYLSDEFNPHFADLSIKNIGNYRIDSGGNIIIGTEILDGTYLSFDDFVLALSTYITFPNHNSILESFANQKEHMEIIANYFGYNIDQVKDWNYIKSLAYDLYQWNDISVPLEKSFFILPIPSISEEDSNMRQQQHQQGNVGVMNQTLYTVKTKSFFPEWAYLATATSITVILFLVSGVVIITRNYL